MRNLPLYEAARFVGYPQRWIQRLLDNEILCSTCRDELEVYMEKAPLINDHEFAEQLLYLLEGG